MRRRVVYMFRVLLWALLIAIVGTGAWWLGVRGKKRPHRREIGFVLLGMIILLPVLTQCHYMFLDEPLVDAAEDGNKAAAENLLNLGADVNDVADDGRGTALIAASFRNHPAVLRLLIQRGADVHKAETYFFNGNRLQTPLQAAEGHPEIIALLKNAGAAR